MQTYIKYIETIWELNFSVIRVILFYFNGRRDPSPEHIRLRHAPEVIGELWCMRSNGVTVEFLGIRFSVRRKGEFQSNQPLC